MYDKMLSDAGFSISDYYITCRRPDTKDDMAFTNVFGEINSYRPPFIIVLDDTGFHFCDELKSTRKGAEEDSELQKYCGSLLGSPQIQYPHYVLPTFGPQYVAAQYKQRDIIVSCDLAKVKAELDWWRTHDKQIKELPQRNLKIRFDTFEELISTLRSFYNSPMLSNDIETIYPKRGSSTKTTSQYYKIHPGYPITVGLAPSKDFGISFDLFRESPQETRVLWRELADLLKKVPQLGQNFFNFDLNFYEMLGFEINIKAIQDTLIRHHILWPELPHKLQFLTRQYTRERYYKDEGHGWSGKDLDRLKRYNALDCCVTYEVYEQQELEFEERPWLR